MRVARGLAALAALLAGLVGVPWLLVALTRQLQPVLAPWRDLPTLLTGPDPLAIMIALLLGVAWAAWLIFVLGVASEVVDLLSGRRLRLRLPGLAATQRLAAGLLVSVVAMISTTQASTAEPVPTQPVPTTAGPESSEPESTDASPHAIHAERGDDTCRRHHGLRQRAQLSGGPEDARPRGRARRRSVVVGPALLRARQ